MKILLAIVAILGAAVWIGSQPAYCAYCSPAPCFSHSQCNAGCYCARSNDYEPGRCMQQ